MNLFGNNFQAWKLHSFADYMGFFAYLLAGIIIFVLIAKYMQKQRNHEKAMKKVAKRLRHLARKPYRLYENATFHLPGGDVTFDSLLADKSGIYLVKTYGWGTKIYGTPDGEMWRRQDTRRKEQFPNPLLELKKAAGELQTVLEEQGVSRIKIMPMVVFADNFQIPELYLGYGSFSTTYQELKVWYRKQSDVKEAQYDFDRVSSILNGILAK